MCLELRWWSRKRTAKQDIVVYKFVEEDIFGKFKTPYQSMPITMGETYTTSINIFGGSIYAGFHSFRSIRAAKRAAKPFKGLVAACIIPKGSVYYNGSWERFRLFNPIAYASDTIRYVELLN